MPEPHLVTIEEYAAGNPNVDADWCVTRLAGAGSSIYWKMGGLMLLYWMYWCVHSSVTDPIHVDETIVEPLDLPLLRRLRCMSWTLKPRQTPHRRSVVIHPIGLWTIA